MDIKLSDGREIVVQGILDPNMIKDYNTMIFSS
jgi:hypothetical protein